MAPQPERRTQLLALLQPIALSNRLFHVLSSHLPMNLSIVSIRLRLKFSRY